MEESTTAAAPEPAPAIPLSKIVTPEKKAFLAALAKAQGEYEPIEKNQTAYIKPRDTSKQPYSFKYADLDAILDGTRKALSTNGISTRVLLTDHDGDSIWLNSIVAHSDGWEDVSSIRVNTVADDVKTFGGRITFMRRYLLGPQIGVAATDDADQDGTAAGEGAAMGDVMQGAKVETRPAGPARKSASTPAAPKAAPAPKQSASTPPEEPPPPEGFAEAGKPAAEPPPEPPPPAPPPINEAEVERQKAGMDARFAANEQKARDAAEAARPPAPPPPPAAPAPAKPSLSAENALCTQGEVAYLVKRMKDHGIAVRPTLDELGLRDVPVELTGLTKGQWKALLPKT